MDMMPDTAMMKTPATPENKRFLHYTTLKPGIPAPEFAAPDQWGNTIELRSFSGRSFLLYFFPKSDTPPCNAQACSLRDVYPQLKSAGLEVLGVSADEALNLQLFSEKYSLPYSLLSDTTLQIIKAYDVWGLKDIAGRYFEGIVRTSFIINPNGIIKQVFEKAGTKNHGQQVLEWVKNNFLD